LWSLAIGSILDKTTDASGAINGPGRPIHDVHPWSSCGTENCWDLAASALRSTRKNAVEEQLTRHRQGKVRDRKMSWKAEEQLRISAGKNPRKEPRWPRQSNLSTDETSAAEKGVRPFIWLDYLYRLRIKANYEDARMFTEGPETEHESGIVLRDLVELASATLLAHELRISRLIGAPVLLAEVDEWLRRNSPPGITHGLAMRRELLRSLS
jgi:hypothetical protein